ncbi:hypothetical protein H5410_049534 [Solanum commersonii]|uniref:AP-5 complex subunit zeta-1 ARM repeats domain-containing protein n=1 Tax=Solanum commersonii TaxID=4109 RepID=A0A9J5WSN7_SOLCO|nr:hypothetical protein H5410_049534 [Solanum commersonii]
MMAGEDKFKQFDFHLRSLSSSARDSNFVSDPSLLNSVKSLCDLCRSEKSEDLIARVYPHLNRIFQRCLSSISQSQTSNGLLLLLDFNFFCTSFICVEGGYGAILQFFLDFGDVVLHDADPNLRTFFKSCLSREFADPVVAEATLDFLNANKKKFSSSFPTLLPQFFPLLLKLIAWNGEKLEKAFRRVFPGLISQGSFLPLFPSIVDFPSECVTLCLSC